MALRVDWRAISASLVLALALTQPAAAAPEDESGISWVPFGPAAAGNPDGSGWYRALERQDCASVHEAGASLGSDAGDPLVLALAAVCAAVVQADGSQWQAAQEHAARARQRPPGCLEVAGEALLARALAWHAAHPGELPELSLPGPGDPVACAFEIAQVQAIGAGEELPQGPLAGGTRLRIIGSGLNEVTAVFIGAQPAVFEPLAIEMVAGRAVEGVIATTPAGAAPGPVDVRVRNRAGEAVAPAAFTYLRPVSPSPSSPSTPD